MKFKFLQTYFTFMYRESQTRIVADVSAISNKQPEVVDTILQLFLLKR